MSVLSVQNMQETFVGRAVGRTGSAQVTNPGATGYIVDGEIVVVNDQGVVVDANVSSTFNTTPFIQIVERNGTELTWSSKIPSNGVLSYLGRTSAQGQEQVYHIGYNPTLGTPAGSLDISSGLDFMLTVIENQDDMMWSEQKKKNVVNVPNNLVATQLDLAKAIVKNQMKKYTTDGSSITACMLNNSNTTVDAHSGSSTLSVVHGSPNIVYTSGGSVVPPSVVSVGSALRIGISASGRGLGVPVYTVKEIQGSGATTVVILDQPYAGPTQTAIPNVDHGVLTVGANYGVRFTGKALPFRRDFFKFKRVSFTLQMSGFGATQLGKSQDALYGYGDGRLVLEEESFSKGFEGALNRMTVPLPTANETFQASATTGTAALIINTVACGDLVTTSTPGGAAPLYDTISIGFFAKDRQTVVAGPDMMQMIKIFSPRGSGQNSQNAVPGNTEIRNALNAFTGQARVGSYAGITHATFQ